MEDVDGTDLPNLYVNWDRGGPRSRSRAVTVPFAPNPEREGGLTVSETTGSQRVYRVASQTSGENANEQEGSTGPQPGYTYLTSSGLGAVLDAARDLFHEPVWDFERHSTISRDQTGASSFRKERLAALSQEKDLWDQHQSQHQSHYQKVRVPMAPPAERIRILIEGQESALAHKTPVQSYKAISRPNTGMNSEAGTTSKEVSASRAPARHIKIAQLEEEIQRLRRVQNTFKSTTWLVLHKIQGEDTAWMDRPSWEPVLGELPHFKGNSPLANEDDYLRQRPDAAFVVYKHYKPSFQASDVVKTDDGRATVPDPKPVREVIQPLSEQMIAALHTFVDSHPTFKDKFPGWRSNGPIESPFLFWYYYRDSTNLDTMAEPHKTQMQLLTEWIDDNYGKMHAEVETSFSRGCVSEATMPFFIRPGEVLVSKSADDIQGYIAESWATKLDSDDATLSPAKVQNVFQSWTVDAWSYGYDGRFYRRSTTLLITIEFNGESPDTNIEDLNTLPIRFGTDEFQTKLQRRGRTMWACRKRTLITYNDTSEDNLAAEGERYMIDFNTYKQLHSDSTNFKTTYLSLGDPERREIDAALMDGDELPEGSESFVFPSTVVGYNLRQKKWHDLQVDCIRPVHWNKQAFKHLVIDEEIKDVIQALVTSKLSTDQTTDLIQGKGNGLIILLHGGPGTGKTFTAESVAELAEKPLFRVTCGDIGTKPEQVEKYLESVLHLGKIWDCVVLLDEADVFLEQRTLTDLERNALVSVFLRVLEYYEGILILTSNRVGTFDEAFKSRIQLSLHYESLTKSQRRSIWANFLNRLNALEQEGTVVQPITDRKRKLEENPGIDFDDIERHLADLAEEQMNGRQIRNAITTARQLAKFKNESMRYRHLEHVIKISRKFDKYLERVRDSYTDDQVAREEGIR
ncbi:uncharacterized protein B0J16DRAFT_1317 [Fusarium flagelliforme]|uniref:uncharacterized protein n=1 Tax=Fusarium flagelliforme TaxID=2675880 RepID=UPI001E8DCEBB|nr:uncharacterized protein B0J16DRAFT_1317 [Fusarium flagelliforme]KAH7196524.1 hypothetical protein B0J16DRAFT_1317 [Fusarium flagelliforme]